MEDPGKEKTGSSMAVHGLMFVATVLVATSFTVGGAIAGAVDSSVLTMLRFLFGAVILLPYIWLRYGLSCSWSLFFRSFMVSGSLVLFFWLMFWALELTTPLNTSVIFTLVPAIGSVYSFFLLKEQLHAFTLPALLVGGTGALWVILGGEPEKLFAMEWNRGDVLFFVGCLCMGLYTVLLKLLYRGEPMIVMTFWILVTGALILFLVNCWRFAAISWGGMSLRVFLGIVYLAVFTSIITFVITQYAAVHIGPTRVMAYSYFYPVLVIILGCCFGEKLPPLKIVPGIIVTVGAVGFILFARQGPKSGRKAS